MLSDLAIRNATPKKARKLFDRGDIPGLYVFLHDNGSKYLRLKYHHAGSEKTLALGVYGKTCTLADARIKAREALAKLEDGLDPSALKQSAKVERKTAIANTFEFVSEDYCNTRAKVWIKSYADDVRKSIEQHLFPTLRTMPVADIKTTDVLAAVKIVERAGKHAMAKKVFERAGKILDHAVAMGLLADPPRLSADALTQYVEAQQPALPEKELGAFLVKLEEFPSEQTRNALKLTLLTGLRVESVVGAKWDEIDFDAGRWTVPGSRMKGRKNPKAKLYNVPHVVPLSKQAVKVLRALEKSAKGGQYVFPGKGKSGHMGEHTMLAAIGLMDYAGRMSPHGARSCLSTIINEHDETAAPVVESILAHVTPGIAGTYNKATYVGQRAKVLQTWADTLDALRKASR